MVDGPLWYRRCDSHLPQVPRLGTPAAFWNQGKLGERGCAGAQIPIRISTPTPTPHHHRRQCTPSPVQPSVALARACLRRDRPQASLLKRPPSPLHHTHPHCRRGISPHHSPTHHPLTTLSPRSPSTHCPSLVCRFILRLPPAKPLTFFDARRLDTRRIHTRRRITRRIRRLHHSLRDTHSADITLAPSLPRFLARTRLLGCILPTRAPPHPRHAPSILDTQAGSTTRPTSPNNPPLTAVFHPHNGTTAAEWRARNAQVRLIFTFWTLVTLHFIMSIFHHRFPKCALCFFPNSISSRPSLFRRHDFCIL